MEKIAKENTMGEQETGTGRMIKERTDNTKNLPSKDTIMATEDNLKVKSNEDITVLARKIEEERKIPTVQERIQKLMMMTRQRTDETNDKSYSKRKRQMEDDDKYEKETVMTPKNPRLRCETDEVKVKQMTTPNKAETDDPMQIVTIEDKERQLVPDQKQQVQTKTPTVLHPQPPGHQSEHKEEEK